MQTLEDVIVVVNSTSDPLPQKGLVIPYVSGPIATPHELDILKDAICEVWYRNHAENNVNMPIAGMVRGLIKNTILRAQGLHPTCFQKLGCTKLGAEAALRARLNPVKRAGGLLLAMWGTYVWYDGQVLCNQNSSIYDPVYEETASLNCLYRYGVLEPNHIVTPPRPTNVVIEAEKLLIVTGDDDGAQSGYCVMCDARGWIDNLVHNQGCAVARALNQLTGV